MFLKKLYCISFLLIITSCSKNKKENFPEKTSSDSLSIYLSVGQNETISDKNKLLYNKRAFELLSLSNNDSVIRNNLFLVANNFFTFKDWNSFKEISDLALKRSISGKDTSNIAKAYRYKAEYYKNAAVNDSAFYFYLKAEKLYTKLHDKISLGKILLKKGIIQFYANDYLGADISTSQAYNLLRNSDDKQTIYQAISMIGIIANEMKDYQKAIEKHNEAYNIVKEFDLNDDNLNQEATSLNNIGNVYQNLNQNDQAIINFNLALKNKKLKINTPDLYAILVDNLAYSKFKLKDYTNLPALFFEALHIRDSLRMSSGVVLSKIHLSEFYAAQHDTTKSQMFAKQAIETARDSRTPSDILASLKQLSLVEHKRSSIYTKEYIRINDSLQQAERKSQNKLARIQLETDEILQEKDQLAEQNRTLLYFFVGSLMIGILLFVIRMQRSKNRELLLKQAQQKANEEIYSLMISQQNKIEESRIREKKRIAQELHDGILGRLFGTRLNLDSLNKVIDQEAIIKRNNYLSELKNIEQDIREISHDLNREKYVLINNFTAILNILLEEQQDSFSTELIVNIDENIHWDLLGNTSKINLYRIIQESLQNVNKYANANSINIIIKKTGENLTLKISDDGIGFAVNTKKKGIGLQNMISRTHELNGIFDIRSKKGKGTIITITIPVENKQIIEV